ncbi:hypothetical protein H8959_013556 [Pygathrix nigripes]
MPVLLIKTLTSHLHYVGLPFPAREGAIVPLSTWVHLTHGACLQFGPVSSLWALLFNSATLEALNADLRSVQS